MMPIQNESYQKENKTLDIDKLENITDESWELDLERKCKFFKKNKHFKTL